MALEMPHCLECAVAMEIGGPPCLHKGLVRRD